MACCSCHINRRVFLGLSAAGTAAVSLAGAAPLQAGGRIEDWNPDKPLLQFAEALKVQPVLMYTVSKYSKQRSFKSWGAIQSDEAAGAEVSRITQQLDALAKESEFPVEVLPVVKARTVEALHTAVRSDTAATQFHGNG